MTTDSRERRRTRERKKKREKRMEPVMKLHHGIMRNGMFKGFDAKCELESMAL